MKSLFFILTFLVSSIGFSQNNYIVKTEDGRRVLLKADYTWEYIDMEKPTTDSISVMSKPLKSSNCNVPQGFTEPDLDSNIQSQLKRGRATIDDIKKKVAKDYKCDIDAVLLLSAKEEKERGTYDFCANGTKVTYKRNGYVILKKGQLF